MFMFSVKNVKTEPFGLGLQSAPTDARVAQSSVSGIFKVQQQLFSFFQQRQGSFVRLSVRYAHRNPLVSPQGFPSR